MAEIAKPHHATRAWGHVMAQVQSEMQRRNAHPSRTVVLVPYAQLMSEARNAWKAQVHGAGFVPRFETTMNWSQSQGASLPSDDDIRLDAAHDSLTARALLKRAGFGAQELGLSERVMEAAWSVARTAAAVPPAEREAWGERMVAHVNEGMSAPALALELAVCRIALAWAAHSVYPTDVLFEADVDLLVVIEGFLSEPLTHALCARNAVRSLVLRLDVSVPAGTGAAQAEKQELVSLQAQTALAPEIRPKEGLDCGADCTADSNASANVHLQAASDSEDEAHRAAAAVLTRLAQGAQTVALVAHDRILTRRVQAMLHDCGIAVRDETGWKLSTTRAAATLVSALNACTWNASTDAMLDWLKAAPAFSESAVRALEVALRRNGTRDWHAVSAVTLAGGVGQIGAVPGQAGEGFGALVDAVNALVGNLRAPRPVSQWLVALREMLMQAGQWEALNLEPSGRVVCAALLLQEGRSQELDRFTGRLPLAEFAAWARQVLESQSDAPEHPPISRVVILPMSQLLGRTAHAVVMAGCDERRLAASVEPPGLWTPSQRLALGLPSRQQLSDAVARAWRYALRAPVVDVTWSTAAAGEALMPSPLVQAMLLQRGPALAPDFSAMRCLSGTPVARPLPSGERLPVARLSATAYDDLRKCPYRFFALRQLGLKEVDELDAGPDKRDFGTWLHAVLHHFHEALKVTPESMDVRRIAIFSIACEQATRELGLSSPEFLPFQAAWPRVRDGYLRWLRSQEAEGMQYEQGEVSLQMPLGRITLIGKIDRIDRTAQGTALLLDYKTENLPTTTARIQRALEDTQLAFYAALLPDDTLAAGYVNVGEKEGTRTLLQDDVVALRDALIDGVQTDMARIGQGAVLAALGAGSACDHCAARGLCRKDFWA